MSTEMATANSAADTAALSDSAEPSDALDSPENLDFEEPLEEANQEASQTGTETDSETDAPVEDGQEAETTENADGADEASEDKAKAEAPAASDDAIVELPGGEKLTVAELKSGHMRDRDYRHKTQELGNKRRDLETLSTRVTQSVTAIADLLVKQIPPAPDPSLAMTDPARYVADKAMHDAMMAQVASVIEQAQAPKDALNKLSDEQRVELLNSENAKLIEAFPQTAKPETRKKFFDDVASVARDIGFSDQELQAVTDHRIFKLAHYARLGMQAEQAKAKAAQKVVNVPPVTPNKRPQGPNAAKVRANQDAVRRLGETGSIHDAMRIDFS
jgi:hypothetical protein